MSKKVLFIKGTPLPAGPSRSMEVARVFIESYQAANPNDELIEKDLFTIDIPYIDGDILSGWHKYAAKETLTEVESQKVAAFAALTEEFVAADKIIIQSSMWNLGIAPQLKGYLDTLMVAGTTFQYTENGPVGLMTDKKAIHIHGSGGVYSNTTGIEHADSFVTGILGFLGAEVAPSILVEGIDYNPEAKEAIMTAAIAKAKETAQTF